MFYLTLSALTEGILEVGADRISFPEGNGKHIFFFRYRDTGEGRPPLPKLIHKKDVYHTLEAAQARVEELKKAEVEKLNKRLAKIQTYKARVVSLP